MINVENKSHSNVHIHILVHMHVYVYECIITHFLDIQQSSFCFKYTFEKLTD